MNAIPPIDRPRYSSRPLPPYSYVPGFAPHPVSDPRGHMHGRAAAFSPDQARRRGSALSWRTWSGLLADEEEYRYGFDLFNHGYYWEAHEAWESLWHAAGRAGPVAIWLKALIKLAAAAVKLREGNARGVERHARRALELLDELATANSPDQAWSGLAERVDVVERFCGVAVGEVRKIAESLIRQGCSELASPAPTRILDQWLALRESSTM